MANSLLIRCLLVILVAFAALLSVLIIRTITLRRPESNLKPCSSADDDFISLDDSVIERFQSGLRFQTVSTSIGNYNRTELERLVQFIIKSYPKLHSSEWVTWQIVANYSLLYHVRGSNPNLRPYLLMSHLDVVPADANEWVWPPFEAKIHDGFINARGTVDVKESVFGILEAVEFLLSNGKRPKRSFYIAFGHDEEVSGLDGARTVARKLQDSGVELEFILDEGVMIVTGVMPFMKKPMALIGVSEKGYLTLKLSTNVTGGHSSIPGRESSIGIVANAVTRLEANPHPSMLGTGPEVGLLEHLALEVPFPLEVVLSNLWLFGPVVSRAMSYSPNTNALIRTTTAVTMFSAGFKENVLAPYAEAIVNHRIHPKQSVKEVIEFDRNVINDERVKLEVVHSTEALPVSDYGPETFGYQTIRATINQIWREKGVAVFPGYPTLHSSDWVTWQIVANYSLLYHVKGSNPSLRPYLLMSHLDVVPADANAWTWPPFGAEIHDGFINARGTVDVKESVFGILEAVEFLLRNGKRPKRSFYVEFGHDEEVSGLDGARMVARKLQDSGVELEFILDEGLMVTTDVVSFVKKPMALIGVSEKGYLTLKLSTNVTGGHSSIPGRESSIGIIANAVARLEANPHPSMLGTGPEVGLLEHLASEVPFLMEVVLTNLWLFGPLVSRAMSNSPLSNALIRTTTAVTMFSAGFKENVLAPYAEAIVNHRIHPKQSVKEVIDFDRNVINDERVRLEVVHSTEALPVSDYGPENFGYQTIRATINQIWKEKRVAVFPGVLIGNTDTRHYVNLTKNIYRFTPAVISKDDIKMVHGINERISIENYQEIINFFYHLIVNSDTENLPSSDHIKSSHQDF